MEVIRNVGPQSFSQQEQIQKSGSGGLIQAGIQRLRNLPAPVVRGYLYDIFQASLNLGACYLRPVEMLSHVQRGVIERIKFRLTNRRDIPTSNEKAIVMSSNQELIRSLVQSTILSGLPLSYLPGNDSFRSKKMTDSLNSFLEMNYHLPYPLMWQNTPWMEARKNLWWAVYNRLDPAQLSPERNPQLCGGDSWCLKNMADRLFPEDSQELAYQIFSEQKKGKDLNEIGLQKLGEKVESSSDIIAKIVIERPPQFWSDFFAGITVMVRSDSVSNTVYSCGKGVVEGAWRQGKRLWGGKEESPVKDSASPYFDFVNPYYQKTFEDKSWKNNLSYYGLIGLQLGTMAFSYYLSPSGFDQAGNWISGAFEQGMINGLFWYCLPGFANDFVKSVARNDRSLDVNNVKNINIVERGYRAKIKQMSKGSSPCSEEVEQSSWNSPMISKKGLVAGKILGVVAPLQLGYLMDSIAGGLSQYPKVSRALGVLGYNTAGMTVAQMGGMGASYALYRYLNKGIEKGIDSLPERMQSNAHSALTLGRYGVIVGGLYQSGIVGGIGSLVNYVGGGAVSLMGSGISGTASLVGSGIGGVASLIGSGATFAYNHPFYFAGAVGSGILKEQAAKRPENKNLGKVAFVSDIVVKGYGFYLGRKMLYSGVAGAVNYVTSIDPYVAGGVISLVGLGALAYKYASRKTMKA